jgi:hypothetical protein
VTVTNSTVTGNSSAGTGGGGISTTFASGAVTVTGSTIGNNTTSYSDGGGIHADSGSVTITGSTITGSTITGNTTTGSSGAGGKVSIYNFNGNTNVVADVVGWY